MFFFRWALECPIWLASIMREESTIRHTRERVTAFCWQKGTRRVSRAATVQRVSRLRTMPHTRIDVRTTRTFRVASSNTCRISSARALGALGSRCSQRTLANGNPRCSASASSVVPSKYVEVAHKLADAAGDITSRYFR